MVEAKPSDHFNKGGQAAALVQRAALEEGARELLRPEMSPRQFVDALVEQEKFADALRLLACALPRREAIWWACQAVRQALGAGLTPPALAALESAERWVVSPSDENRRASFAAAEQADFGTPAGCVGAAVFWSGGSMAPPKLQAVPPPEHLTPNAVANALILAGVVSEPEKAAEKYRSFITLALDVVNGTNRWKEERPAPAKPAATRR